MKAPFVCSLHSLKKLPQKKLRAGIALLTAALAFCAHSSAARADELEFNWGGRLQHDLRFRLESVGVGEFYGRYEFPAGIERSQSIAGLNFNAAYGTLSGQAAADFVLYGISPDAKNVGDLFRIEKTDPYRIEFPALFIDVKDLIFKGLDLRLGQQAVLWGEADQFNPTNNLNPDDLRDPLLFGRQASNFMLKLDYWVSESLSISGVLVPIFRPALVPETGLLSLAAIDRVPLLDDKQRQRLISDLNATGGPLLGHPTIVSNTILQLPDRSAKNMQFAYRLAGTIAEQDVALSYYNGFSDFPQPIQNHTTHKPGAQCNPSDSSDCIKGLLQTEVTLSYPRMHVYGLNVAGEIPLDWISETLEGLGYRFEGALIVPAQSTLKITNEDLALEIPQKAGEYDYDGDGVAGGPQPLVIDSTPFLKWTIGLDYTFPGGIYVNAQWVHGLMDEFGAGDFISPGVTLRQSSVSSTDAQTINQCALPKDGSKCAQEITRDRLGDYIVLGIDYHFLNDAALFRLFTIWDITGFDEEHWEFRDKKRVRTHYSFFSEEGFSAVIYPEFNYNFGNGLDMGLGLLLQLGKGYSKFGDPAAGGSLLWTRGRFSF